MTAEQNSAAKAGERGRRVRMGIGSSILARGLGVLANLVTIPLVLKFLGGERYGIWSTVFATVSWVAVLDLGIADNLTNRVSGSYASGDSMGAKRAVTNALILTVTISLLLGLLFAITWSQIPFERFFSGISSRLQAESVRTIAAAICVILVGLVSNLFGKILAGYQEISRYNAWSTSATILSVLGVIVGIKLGVSMPILILLTVGMSSWCGMLGLSWVVLWAKPFLRPTWEAVSSREIKLLAGGGFGFFITHVAVVIGFGTDNLVIGHYLGFPQVTPYAITWRLAAYAGVFQSLVFPTLWPAYAEAYARGDISWLKNTYRRTFFSALSLSLFVFVVLAVAGKSIIRVWAGAEAVPSTALLLAVGGWNIVASIMAVQSNLLGAVGRNRTQGWLSLLASIANVAASVYLVQRVGAIGAVIGTGLAYLAILVVPQTRIVSSLLSEAIDLKDIVRATRRES